MNQESGTLNGATRQSSFLELTFSVATATVFLLGPFTWTYLASVQGFLFRPVDAAMLALIFFAVLRGKIALSFGPIPFALLLVSAGLMVQFMFRGNGEYAISSLKIAYYLLVSICIATAVRISMRSPDRYWEAIALLIVIPVFATFFFAIVRNFRDILFLYDFFALFEIVRELWHRVFSHNLFSVQIDLDVTGVEFRNSAGIAFFVAGLFFHLSGSRLGSTAMVLFMIIAASLFSRSVWALQVVFIALSLFSARQQYKSIWFFLLIGVAMSLLLFDGIHQAIESRVFSNFGREDSWIVAVHFLEQFFFLGVAGGERVLLPDGEVKAVHNVPLALGLKGGVFFLCLAVFVQFWFLLTAIRSLNAVLSRPESGSRQLVVLAVLSMLLFVRPLLSASHSVYFSVGEWCAFGLFLALGMSTPTQGRKASWV